MGRDQRWDEIRDETSVDILLLLDTCAVGEFWLLLSTREDFFSLLLLLLLLLDEPNGLPRIGPADPTALKPDGWRI
jgi:hypothetical protein